MPKNKVDFRYTTIADIREEGLSSDQANDTKLNRLIRFYSNRINRWCAQWFFPIKEVALVNGNTWSSVWREDKMPILEVDELAVNVLGSTTFQGTIVPSEDFEIDVPAAFDSPGRILSLRVTGGFIRFENEVRVLRFPVLGKFPKGPRHVRIIGSFGWIDQKDKVSTTTTAALASDAKSIVVVDACDFDVGDAVRIGTADPFVYILISSISGNVLSFDDIGRIPATIASGDAVVTYGRVPDAIQQACKRLVIEQRFNIGSAELREARDADSLSGERIGDYSYTKLVPKYKNASTTGSREVDLILQDYVAPLIPIFTR